MTTLFCHPFPYFLLLYFLILLGHTLFGVFSSTTLMGCQMVIVWYFCNHGFAVTLQTVKEITSHYYIWTTKPFNTLRNSNQRAFMCCVKWQHSSSDLSSFSLAARTASCAPTWPTRLSILPRFPSHCCTSTRDITFRKLSTTATRWLRNSDWNSSSDRCRRVSTRDE